VLAINASAPTMAQASSLRSQCEGRTESRIVQSDPGFFISMSTQDFFEPHLQSPNTHHQHSVDKCANPFLMNGIRVGKKRK
jgi:hypothetical protein